METSSTAETAARLRRAITRMNRKLRGSTQGTISPAQVSMLASIEKGDNPSLGDLAVAEQVQPPSVTRMAHAMELAGLIQLVQDSDDRRCTRVQITALGKAELASIRQRKTEFLERTLIALSPSERRKADELVTFLEALLEEL